MQMIVSSAKIHFCKTSAIILYLAKKKEDGEFGGLAYFRLNYGEQVNGEITTDRFYKLSPGEQNHSYVFVCFVDFATRPVRTGSMTQRICTSLKTTLLHLDWPPCSTVSRKPSVGGPVRWSGSPQRRGCETWPVERHCLPVKRATKAS